MGRGAIYTNNARSDNRSVTILRYILDPNRVVCDVKDNDKVPNYDGYFELINPKGESLGKLEVQVKTLKRGYNRASYSVSKKLIEYVVNAAQLPVLLIAVDREKEKVFWEHLSIQKTRTLLERICGLNQKSATVHFPDSNEITLYEPYKAWEELASDYRRRIDENESRELIIIEIKIDKKAHILSQLKELSELLYGEIDFIPLHILIQQYPLRDNSNSRYNSFVLNTFNDKVKRLLDAITIEEQSKITLQDAKFFKGIKNPEERISTILEKFTSNLIYYIRTPDQRDSYDTRYFRKSICRCARCQIEKFSFDAVDFAIEVKDTKTDELLNLAYGHYKMGHFKKVYHLYKEALDVAIAEKRELSVYLIQYNLTHLASLIEGNYYSDEESKEIARELRNIDISGAHCTSDNAFHREIMEWMLNDYYMKHFYSKISEVKQQLIDHYQSSINGGSGSNNFVNELINQYAQLHQFLQRNTIINDCYKPFHDIVEMVIEGLFASYAVAGGRSSKIDSVNDWLLSQMIKYGRTGSIRRLVNRYKIKELHYENDNQDHDSIKTQILRLFQQFEVASEKLQAVKEPNYNYFSNEYKRWLNNSLYVVGLVDFDAAFVRKFTDAFISYYKRKTHRLDTTEIGSFLNRKYHLFTKSQRKELLLLGIHDEQLMRSFYLHNFAQQSEEHKESFKLVKTDFDLIIQRSFNQLSDIDSLVHVFRCLADQKQKNVIQQKITDTLANSFELDVWNAAVLYNVIPLKVEDLLKAVELLTPKKDLAGKPGNPFGGARYNGALDQFINVCFDKEIDLSERKFDGLRENSHYYQWLLNIDDFDYTNFDSSWLMEYGTEPYLRRFSKSVVLKGEIEVLLNDPKEKNREGLKESYMDIYVIQSWNL